MYPGYKTAKITIGECAKRNREIHDIKLSEGELDELYESVENKLKEYEKYGHEVDFKDGRIKKETSNGGHFSSNIHAIAIEGFIELAKEHGYITGDIERFDKNIVYPGHNGLMLVHYFTEKGKAKERLLESERNWSKKEHVKRFPARITAQQLQESA